MCQVYINETTWLFAINSLARQNNTYVKGSLFSSLFIYPPFHAVHTFRLIYIYANRKYETMKANIAKEYKIQFR